LLKVEKSSSTLNLRNEEGIQVLERYNEVIEGTNTQLNHFSESLSNSKIQNDKFIDSVSDLSGNLDKELKQLNEILDEFKTLTKNKIIELRK
jgi:ABC-type transporter Mla subunit MlaD